MDRRLIPVAQASSEDEVRIRRISVNPNTGEYGAAGNSEYPAISSDGRFVAFESRATNLVTPDDNGTARDILVYDLALDTIERVSVHSDGTQGNGNSYGASISADGRFVAFESQASNLVDGDTNGESDVFVHDRKTGETVRASVTSSGGQARGYRGVISADGRFVAFESDSAALPPGGWNTHLRDLEMGTTELVSISTDLQRTGGGAPYSVSPGGRFVVFGSSTNLRYEDLNGRSDVYLRDRMELLTEQVSVNDNGDSGTGAHSLAAAASHDAHLVVFASGAQGLAAGSQCCFQVFERDRVQGTTRRLSQAPQGQPGNKWSHEPDISGDGRFAVFHSDATNLVDGGTNGKNHVYIHDRVKETLELISVGHTGAQADRGAFTPSISYGGAVVAFASNSSNLVPGTSNLLQQIYVRELGPPQSMPAEQSYGSCGWGTHAANPSDCQSDPVNSATGSFTTHVTDAVLPGVGLPFVLSRTYNSADAEPGPMGRGWSHSLGPSLSIDWKGDVILRAENGQRVRYMRLSGGSYRGDPGARSVLEKVGDTYALTRRDQVVYSFDADGLLHSLEDRNGNATTLDYDA